MSGNVRNFADQRKMKEGKIFRFKTLFLAFCFLLHLVLPGLNHLSIHYAEANTAKTFTSKTNHKGSSKIPLKLHITELQDLAEAEEDEKLVKFKVPSAENAIELIHSILARTSYVTLATSFLKSQTRDVFILNCVFRI